MRALAKRFCDNFLFNMLLFKLIFLVATLFTAMPFVHDYLGRYIKILLAWGAVILLHDLLTKRLCVRNRYAGFFVLFIAAYAVTVLLNRQLNFSANFSQLAYMILFMFGFAAYDPATKPRGGQARASTAGQRLSDRHLCAVALLFFPVPLLCQL